MIWAFYPANSASSPRPAFDSDFRFRHIGVPPPSVSSSAPVQSPPHMKPDEKESAACLSPLVFVRIDCPIGSPQ